MVYVGIDVAKEKHDCCVMGADGVIIVSPFRIKNNIAGFDLLLQTITTAEKDLSKIKVGLEATGHYGYNIIGFLLNSGLQTVVFNPLHTSLFRKSMSLRKTKTDKVDCKIIAKMLLSNTDLKPYSMSLYHNEELKSLSRYRFNKIQERSKLKTSVTRLINILFPELEDLVTNVHMNSVYALLSEYPGASFVSEIHITKLTNILLTASHGLYRKTKAMEIKEAARRSIGTAMPAKSLELKHTITLIQHLNKEIDEVESCIKDIMNKIDSPMTTIPGISFRMASMIIAEIGDFNKFDSSDKILAFAGFSPSTYQSGKLDGAYAHMEKRGSPYLRYALYNAAKFVCKWEPVFGCYLEKKRAEGKHYNVAISHVVKKLVRVIYHLEKTGQNYTIAT
ncbi:MAG: IS110 family transposase [Paludibacteraceae bacterium]